MNEKNALKSHWKVDYGGYCNRTNAKALPKK